MTRTIVRAAAAVLVSLAVLGWSAPTAVARSRVLFRITDGRIDEASGIAVGRSSPAVLYVQNDSGDSSRFFALDRGTGATVAVIHVADARNEDWEDLAAAPDRAGTPSVWLADIGDNTASRPEVRVYRVEEPALATTTRDEEVRTARPDLWRLRYPTGATDAESFAVAPGGVGYVVTKSLLGASVVYRMPLRPDPEHVQALERVGSIVFRLTGTQGGPNPLGQLTATGAAFSPDGSLFVVRTYTDAYLWRVADGDLAAALAREPTRLALPAQPQGEGVTFDGTTLLLDSEQVGSAVYAVPLSSIALRPTAPTPARTPASAATVSRAPTTRASPRVAHREGNDGRSTAALIGLAGAAAALVLLAEGIRRRRSARR